MLKPQSLLDFLTAAVPLFQSAPDQLSMLVRRGRIVCAGASSLSFEYAYTLQLVALDFTGHPDAIVVPLLAWLRTNQPDIADNPELREKAVRFEAEYTGRKQLDVIIELDLTERVLVTRRPPADPQPDPTTTFERWDIRHVGEPERDSTTSMNEHWELYSPDGELLNAWDMAPDRF